MNFIISNVKAVSETIINLEKKLGITKVIQYFLFFLVVYIIANFNSVLETMMKIYQEIEKKEHEERLILRDKLMTDLNPLLVELRSSTGASRVLYFEYHNSTENFVGIPFKFANLVLSNQVYGCSGYDPTRYKDINSGLISSIYDDLRKYEIIMNRGSMNDSIFYLKYPEIQEFFSSQDNSEQQVFVNLPGVNFPMGMIVLEWVDDNRVAKEEEWLEIKDLIYSITPRINALISKYTP